MADRSIKLSRVPRGGDSCTVNARTFRFGAMNGDVPISRSRWRTARNLARAINRDPLPGLRAKARFGKVTIGHVRTRRCWWCDGFGNPALHREPGMPPCWRCDGSGRVIDHRRRWIAAAVLLALGAALWWML